LFELVAVERDAEAGTVGNRDRAVAISELAADDDVVDEMVVMRVGRVGQVGQHGAEMQHGRELDAELSGGMDGHAELEGLAYACCLDARADAAPEGGVQKDDIEGSVMDVGAELLEVDHRSVGGERHVDVAAQLPCALEPPRWIFEVIVVEIADTLAKANCLFKR